MDIPKCLEHLRIDSGLSKSDIGAKLGTRRQDIYRRFYNIDHRVSDLATLADAMDYDLRIQFVSRKTGKVIDCD